MKKVQQQIAINAPTLSDAAKAQHAPQSPCALTRPLTQLQSIFQITGYQILVTVTVLCNVSADTNCIFWRSLLRFGGRMILYQVLASRLNLGISRLSISSWGTFLPFMYSRTLSSTSLSNESTSTFSTALADIPAIELGVKPFKTETPCLPSALASLTEASLEGISPEYFCLTSRSVSTANSFTASSQFLSGLALFYSTILRLFWQTYSWYRAASSEAAPGADPSRDMRGGARDCGWLRTRCKSSRHKQGQGLGLLYIGGAELQIHEGRVIGGVGARTGKF